MLNVAGEVTVRGGGGFPESFGEYYIVLMAQLTVEKS